MDKLVESAFHKFPTTLIELLYQYVQGLKKESPAMTMSLSKIVFPLIRKSFQNLK